MEIIGHGVDLIELGRVDGLLRRNEDFLFGWFTEREIDDLGARAGCADVVGGRVAAKEATVKALGVGFAGDVTWLDVEILVNAKGAPVVALSGGALDVATSLGVVKIFVSISHTQSAAVASAIAVGSPPTSQCT